MDKLVYTAASGLRAHMAAQAAIANNMANASTTGFRADRAVFDRLQLDGPGFADRAPAGEERDLGAARGELDGGGAGDARARPGDDDGLGHGTSLGSQPVSGPARRTAASRSSACTNAWGRLPRSWCWVT